MDSRPPRLAPPISQEEDDFAEPEIPEYLLAERRRNAAGRGGRPQGGGGRGGARSAYASAMDRERYGTRGTSSRYPEPARPMPSQSQPPRRRDDRPVRQPQPQQRRGGVVTPRPGRDSSEPWSEVPPELEELLRAQLSTKLSRPAETETGRAPEAVSAEASDAVEVKAKPAPRSRRKPAAAAEAAAEGMFIETFTLDSVSEAPVEKAKPAPRSRRKPVEATAEPAVEVAAAPSAEGAEPAAPKKRAPARRKPAAAAQAPVEGGEPTGE
jgi:hypothetical protein